MILEISKYFRYIKKSIFNPGGLNYLILYVTSKCNSACKTCFFHKNLNKESDLTLNEYKKISEHIGPLSVLLLSGGEPFLRDDVMEICSFFIVNNKIDTLVIPTNGILTKKILDFTEELVRRFPRVAVSVNPSLDGMAEYHDMVRGVSGCFENALATIRGLEILKKKYKNIQITVNSVVHKDNISELKELATYLSGFNIDSQAFEIMRGEWRDKSLKPADVDQIKDFHDFILMKRAEKIRNIFEKIIVIGSLRYIYGMKENFFIGERWPIKCAAGRSIVVVYPDGAVSLCELKEPIGNLRDEDFDIKKILKSEKAVHSMVDIDKSKCSCTHICFLNASLAGDWRSIFKVLYSYFKKI